MATSPQGGRARAMGYVADDHSFTRGPGAIASLDAASPRRRQARLARLAADQARDAARARATLGALPLVPLAKLAGKVATSAVAGQVSRMLMPGQRLSNVSPGSVQTAKYPGIPGYQHPVTYGTPVKVRMPGASVRPGSVRTSSDAGSPILGTSRPTTVIVGGVTLPSAGGVSPNSGALDPGATSGGSTPGADGSGGGGGGEGSSALPDGGSSADDGSWYQDPADDSTQSTDPGADTTTMTPVDPSQAIAALPSNNARNWLIAAAVIAGGYWLLTKH